MKLVLLLWAILSGYLAIGQTNISGKIMDEEGEPIPGANITIVGSYDGTSSTYNGSFDFTTTETGEQLLAISFVGFKSVEQRVILQGQPVEVYITLKEMINELDAVVITAGSFTAGEENRRTILKAVDIATTAGATADIAGALNTLPGTQKVGESGRLFVRGGDGNETRTFIDGMLVLDPYLPSAPNTPSRGRFLPFMFKGTSFSTGGYSSEYGQALSSALVLNSRDKAELNQTDIGLLSVGGDVAHTQVWDQSSLSAKVQYTNIRPYFGLINQEIDWIKPPVSWEGSTAFRQELGESGMFKFFGNYNHSNYSLYQHSILDSNQKIAYELTNDYGYGNASFIRALDDSWVVRGGISLNKNVNDVRISGAPLRETDRGAHAKVVIENDLSDKMEIKFGVEHISIVREVAGIDSLLTQPQVRATQGITAGFVEAEAYVSKKLVTRAGARTEYNHRLSQLHVDPRVSMAYQPFHNGQFSLAYGRFRQTPQFNHLLMTPSLEEEIAEHYIFNYQVINDQRTFRAELYYKAYRNLIKYSTTNPGAITNNGEGFARGFELFWRDNKTFKNVDYWLSYSYLNTERDYLDFPEASIPSFASAHNFSVVYKHFITDIKSQIGLTYSYSSPRPYNNPNQETFNSGRTPSYQDLSMNFSYLPKPSIIIHASVTNLFGRDNIFGYEYSVMQGTDGLFAERAIRQPAKRFLFLGIFFTISKNKSINQLPNL